MRFTKMHGCGNDYIYVNCFEEKVENPGEVSLAVSDRHFGVGSDGLVLICPSEIADFKMDMYNSDGSQGKMCGNATRCVGKYVYDNKMTDKTEISLETLSGIKYISLTVENGTAVAARVNMGSPILTPSLIPVSLAGENVVDRELVVDGETRKITCVSMGNPHCVVFVDETEGLQLEKIGPGFEHHAVFPDRTNTEFVKVIDNRTLQMRVWERGAGETLACGTGTCAAVAAAVLNGICRKDEDITVRLVGGELTIRWDSGSNDIFMTGPAEKICTGEF